MTMTVHRFAVGQNVSLKSKMGLAPGTADVYRIIATLPAKDGSPQYRIRNDKAAQERVVMEYSIQEIDKPAFQHGSVCN